MQKEYLGGAVGASLAATITNTDTSIQVNQANGWPAGPLPFVALITNGTIQEKVLCSSRSGTVLAVQQRGYDGTVAQDWSTGAQVVHVFDAESANQFSEHANSDVGHGASLLPVNSFTPTESGDSYPDGFSIFAISSSNPGWPGTIATGMVITIKANLNSHLLQEYMPWWESTAEQRWQRRWNYSTSAWTQWRQLATREWANTMERKVITGDITLDSTYAGCMVESTATTPVVVTLNNNFELGTVISFTQWGASPGEIQFVVDGGSLRHPDNATKIANRWGMATVWYRSANNWILSGDVA